MKMKLVLFITTWTKAKFKHNTLTRAMTPGNCLGNEARTLFPMNIVPNHEIFTHENISIYVNSTTSK